MKRFRTFALFLLALSASAAPLALPPLDWTLSGAATLNEDGILEIDAPPDAPGGGATARFDLRPLRGKSFRLTVRASMEGVPRPKFNYEGLKFQFSIYDRLIRKRSYPESIRQRFGDMAETTLELRYDAAVHDADEAKLFLGLQNASGRVRFDLRTLAIEETPSAFTITNQDYIVRYSDVNVQCSQIFNATNDTNINVNDNLDLRFVNNEDLPFVNNHHLRGCMIYRNV